MEQPNPNPNVPGVGGLTSRIVCIRNAVTYDDLINDEEYEDIMEEMKESACTLSGLLLKVVIPRPNPKHDHTPGLGKVFLEYANSDHASRVIQRCDGTEFSGNIVVAEFYPEDAFAKGDYDG